MNLVLICFSASLGVACSQLHDQHHGYHCPAVAAFFHIRNWCWLDQGWSWLSSIFGHTLFKIGQKPKKACSINWWRWSEYHACCIKIFSAISSSSTCLNIETHTHGLHYQQLIPFGKLLIQLLQTSDGMWVVQYFCVIFVNIQSCTVDCFCKFTYKTLLHYSNHSVCSI